jgi:hypothetical protein
MLYRMVSLNSTVSWGTTAMAPRSEAWVTVRVSWPGGAGAGVCVVWVRGVGATVAMLSAPLPALRAGLHAGPADSGPSEGGREARAMACWQQRRPHAREPRIASTSQAAGSGLSGTGAAGWAPAPQWLSAAHHPPAPRRPVGRRSAAAGAAWWICRCPWRPPPPASCRLGEGEGGEGTGLSLTNQRHLIAELCGNMQWTGAGGPSGGSNSRALQQDQTWQCCEAQRRPYSSRCPAQWPAHLTTHQGRRS